MIANAKYGIVYSSVKDSLSKDQQIVFYDSEKVPGNLFLVRAAV